MKQVKLLLVLVATLALTACAEKKENKQTIEPRSAPRGGLTPTTGTNGTNTAQGQQAVLQSRPAGAIESTAGVDDGQFTLNIKNFLSASLSPDQIGDVSGNRNSTTTGVRVWVDLLRNQSIDKANAQLLIVIYDTKYQQEGAITVALGKGKLIQATQNGSSLTLVFADQYGSITLSGSIQGSYFQGTITYQNTTHYDGGTPMGGNLGTFMIPVSSMYMI